MTPKQGFAAFNKYGAAFIRWPGRHAEIQAPNSAAVHAEAAGGAAKPLTCRGSLL